MKTKINVEKEVVLKIEERVDDFNSISTILELEVEYDYPIVGEGSFPRRKNSNRTIIVEKVVDGKKETKLYNVEGFIAAERVMDVHTENYLSTWSINNKTKINYIGTL